MFSAIKRLASKNDSVNNDNALPSANIPHGVQTMSTSLQKKFSRGVQYNMKIIIKGDRNVGKTCLFHRLQGKKFVEEYIPTDEIQVASIQWNYNATDDVVKVEVWDVVDRGKKKRPSDSLKLETNAQLYEQPLDAQFLDVYKNTNGVIFVMDSTKSWTFDYVQNELHNVPDHVPVIILANHCDMSHHRTVSAQQIAFFIEQFNARPAQVRYAEASMRNGFGLKYLHKFFNLPFLQLQRDTIQRTLERNSRNISATLQELDLYAESEDADYSKFIDKLTDKRRQVADMNSPRTSIQLTQTAGVNVGILQKSNSIIVGGGQPIPTKNHVASGHAATIANKIKAGATGDEQNIVTKIFSANIKDGQPMTARITSVDEFCPSDGATLDRAFLDDAGDNNARRVENQPIHYEEDSDSDTNETCNPLVKDLEDDLDPNDLEPYSIPKINIEPSKSKQIEQIPARRDSLSSDDTELKQLAENDTVYDPNWSGSDSKWRRRSPEGGEDVSNVSKTLDETTLSPNDDTASVNSSVNSELLKTSEKVSKTNKKSSSDKSEKKHKSSKKSSGKDKEKDTSRKKTKSSKRTSSRDETNDSRDELEEFLNGGNTTRSRDAYEAL